MRAAAHLCAQLLLGDMTGKNLLVLVMHFCIIYHLLINLLPPHWPPFLDNEVVQEKKYNYYLRIDQKYMSLLIYTSHRQKITHSNYPQTLRGGLKKKINGIFH